MSHGCDEGNTDRMTIPPRNTVARNPMNRISLGYIKISRGQARLAVTLITIEVKES